MAKARNLSFDEFMALANENYSNGGDSIVECWDERTFNEYVSMFGPVTKGKAMKMFKLHRSVDRDRAGWN